MQSCRPPGRAATRWTSSAMRRPNDTSRRCRSCWRIRRRTRCCSSTRRPQSCRVRRSPTAVVPAIKRAQRNVLACWLGGDAVQTGGGCFRDAGIPTYDTPEEAVRAFVQIVQYRRNQDLLMEVPPSRSAEFAHDRAKGADRSDKRPRGWTQPCLSEPEAKAVLAAYGIPVVETRIATTPGEAARYRGGDRLSRRAQDPFARHHPQVRRWRRRAGS